MDEACDHDAVESMGKDEQLLREAVRKTREGRQCLALFLAEAGYLWRRRLSAELTESFAADDGRLGNTGYKRRLRRA